MEEPRDEAGQEPADAGGEGEPQPVRGKRKWVGPVVTAAIIVGAGLLVFPDGCLLGHTHGATISARLTWRQRQAEIEAAAAAAAAELPGEKDHADNGSQK